MGIRTNIFEIFVLIIFSLTVIKNCFDLTIKKINWGPVWPYLFLLISFISVFFAADKAHAAGIFKGWFLSPVIFYWVVINTFDKKNIINLAIPVYISVIIVSVWAILQKIGLITTLFYQSGDVSFAQYLKENLRVFGPFESPNYLAMFLVPTFFLSFFLFEKIKSYPVKSLIAFLLLLPVVSVLLSGSRAGVLAMVFSSILFLLLRDKKGFKISYVLSGSFLVVIIIALITFIGKVGLHPGGDAIRIEIYQYSWEILKQNWLFGIGLGEYQTTIREFAGISESFKTHALPYALHPHDIFLAMWLNLGVLGFLSFLALLFYFFKNSLSINKTAKAILVSAMSAIIIHGLFDTTYYKNDLSAIFWLIFAYLIIYKNEKSKFFSR